MIVCVWYVGGKESDVIMQVIVLGWVVVFAVVLRIQEHFR